jgi:hypothetical protein
VELQIKLADLQANLQYCLTVAFGFPTNITVELESGGEKGNSITPTPINLWIIIAVFVILVTGILLGFMLFRKKQMMRMMKR